MVPVSTCSDRGDILIGLLQGEQNIHSFPAIFNLLEQGWDVPVGIRTRDNIDKLLFFNNLIPHALCHAAENANCQMFFFSFEGTELLDRKSTRLNSSHVAISYAVFCLKKKKT